MVPFPFKKRNIVLNAEKSARNTSQLMFDQIKQDQADLEYYKKVLNNYGLNRTRVRLHNLARNKSKKKYKIEKTRFTYGNYKSDFWICYSAAVNTFIFGD